MQISSPQILLMFVAMGGIIAYLGDWLGRKMGKKRLRIAGLRPRHTATFFTVVMGMLIPIATTYAIITISAPVRQWLAEGPELASKRDALLTQIASLKTQADKRDSEIKQQDGRIKLANFQREQASRQRDIAVTNKGAVERQMAIAKQDLRNAQVLQSKIRSRVSELEGREHDLSSSVADKSKLLEKQEHEVTRLRKESASLMKNSIDLYRQIQDLESRTQQERQKVDQARKEKDQAEAETQQWYGKIVDLRKVVMELQQTSASLYGNMEAARTRNVIFRKGEELARLTIVGGLDSTSARAKLMQLEAMASVSAKERGVKPDSTGKAAGYSDIRRALPDGSAMIISVEDQLSAFIREIGRTNQDLVLIGSSYVNYFELEPRFVPLQLNMFINKVVYKSGETVADTTIDGSKPDGEIFDAIIEFLRNKVRRTAEAKGMIPVHGQDGSLGEVSYQQMTGLVNQLRMRAGPTKVTAVASKAAKTAESLSIKFKVSMP